MPFFDRFPSVAPVQCLFHLLQMCSYEKALYLRQKEDFWSLLLRPFVARQLPKIAKSEFPLNPESSELAEQNSKLSEFRHEFRH